MSSTNIPLADVILPDNRTSTTGVPVPASLAIGIGDLMYWDSANNVVRPFSSFTTLASEVLDQVFAARNFMGVALQGRLAADTTTTGKITVLWDGVVRFPCVSNTFNVGDMVGSTWNGGSSTTDQFVTKLTIPMPHRALGVVVRYEATAVTSVYCRLLSRFGGFDIMHTALQLGAMQGVVTSGTMADANTTLTVASAQIQTMVPTAARNVTLPLEAQSKGLTFYLINNSAGAFSLTVLGSAGGNVKGNPTIAQNKVGLAFCDGTTWTQLVSA